MKIHEFKKVLIALDYDNTAQRVAEEGYSMARAMKAEVVLLHVISDPTLYSAPGHVTIMGFAGHVGVDPIQTESIDGLRKASQFYLDKSKIHLGDESIITLVKEGGLAESVLSAAEEINADIIVMGSHSRKWMENIIMGSVTEKVLRHTLIPLFIVPTKKQG